MNYFSFPLKWLQKGSNPGSSLWPLTQFGKPKLKKLSIQIKKNSDGGPRGKIKQHKDSTSQTRKKLNLLKELEVEVRNAFNKCMRMLSEDFNYLLNLVAPIIRKPDTCI